MNILLPSTVTDALQALGRVAVTSDVEEYLHPAEVRMLEALREILLRLRATAEQVCEDPRHDVRSGVDGWIEAGLPRGGGPSASGDVE